VPSTSLQSTAGLIQSQPASEGNRAYFCLFGIFISNSCDGTHSTVCQQEGATEEVLQVEYENFIW